MKKIFTLLCAFAAATPLMAQTDEAIETIETIETATESVPLGQTILSILLAVVILGASLAMLAHMIYENFIRKPLSDKHTADEFIQARREASLAESSTEEEIAYINQRLDEVVATWGSIPGDDGEPIPFPLKKSHIKLGQEVLEESINAMPTDAATIERINGLATLLNSALERTFNGSKTLIITSIIVGVVLGLVAGTPQFMVMVGVGLVIYWFASRTPDYVLIRKELNGNGGKRSFLTRIIGGLFAGVAAAKTYKTITTYSDGSQTTDYDNSETWISLAFTLIVIVMLAVFIWVFAAINYLRNYVLHI